MAESYQYPNGHINHLDKNQEATLEEFKVICEKEGYYKPSSASKKPSHDDETLLRYLRARKFVPKDAFTQLKDTEDWRKDIEIEELYDTVDVDDYEFTRKLYPQWTGRRDQRGIPFYVFEVAHLTSEKMSEYGRSIENSRGKTKLAPNLQRLFALYENLITFTFPLCSGIANRPIPETPVSQSSNLVDISGVTPKQFWNIKKFLQDASQLATAHYPETLDRIFIVGAPSFFPTIWAWLKRWFDPITVSKIFILTKENTKSTLEQYLDPECIPKKYGGTLDWQWGELPSLEPEMRGLLRWREDPPKHPRKAENAFPIGPIRWHERPTGDLEAYAVGTKDGKLREEYVATLPSVAAQTTTAPESNQLEKTSTLERDVYLTPMTTSGTHTHPADSSDYFPRTGDTPQEVSEPPSGAGTPAQSQPSATNHTAATAVATEQLDHAPDTTTEAVHRSPASPAESVPPPPPPKPTTAQTNASPTNSGTLVPTGGAGVAETPTSGGPLENVTDSLPTELSDPSPSDTRHNTTSPSSSARQAIGTTSTAVGGSELTDGKSSGSGFSSAMKDGAAVFAEKGSTAMKGGAAAVVGAGGEAKGWGQKFRSRMNWFGSKRNRGSKDLSEDKGRESSDGQPQKRVVPVTETF